MSIKNHQPKIDFCPSTTGDRVADQDQLLHREGRRYPTVLSKNIGFQKYEINIYNCKVATFVNHMNISNPVFAVALTLLAFLAIKITFIFEDKSPPPMRFATINGLRGYLALFVMLHHACMWFVLVQTGKWDVPRPNLYGPLGQASVLMFFMITSFYSMTNY